MPPQVCLTRGAAGLIGLVVCDATRAYISPQIWTRQLLAALRTDPSPLCRLLFRDSPSSWRLHGVCQPQGPPGPSPRACVSLYATRDSGRVLRWGMTLDCPRAPNAITRDLLRGSRGGSDAHGGAGHTERRADAGLGGWSDRAISQGHCQPPGAGAALPSSLRGRQPHGHLTLASDLRTPRK